MLKDDPGTRQVLWGTVSRRQRWGLSRRGWLAAIVLGVITVGLVLTGLHPFLAQTRRVETTVLVVEGWIDKFAIQAAAKEFFAHHYTHVFSTGGPVVGLGGYVNDFQTSASVGADSLKSVGVPAERVQMVPSHVSGRDRTYSSALALRDWFAKQGVKIASFNVLTEDAHARRTRLLYRKAFGKEVEIGVISVPNPDYDARRWWRYSQGVREVFSESIAYLYARFFFWPSKLEQKTNN